MKDDLITSKKSGDNTEVTLDTAKLFPELDEKGVLLWRPSIANTIHHDLNAFMSEWNSSPGEVEIGIRFRLSDALESVISGYGKEDGRPFLDAMRTELVAMLERINAVTTTDKDKMEVTLLGKDSDDMTVLVRDQLDPKLNGIYSMKRMKI